MHTMSGQPLQGKILGAAPGLDADAAYACKISDDKGINTIILSNVVKGLLIVLHFLWIEAVNTYREWGQQVAGR
ncbi:hypothetical protein BN191_170042 [Clostridioides difficile T61]|nr:hypothetical protein BN169_170042 [Clostridioides difficile E16]CCL94191.1 hypothetical protein BN191_170042 [Clostridioides difficile T61]